MGKKIKEINSLKKSFSRVLAALKKQKDKHLRSSALEQLEISLKAAQTALKKKTDPSQLPADSPVTAAQETENQTIQPSEALINELKGPEIAS